MNSLFIFLIQSSIALLLFYLVYWLFLRKETHYNSNRFFLLFALLASILMPLIPLQYTVMVKAGINGSIFLTEIGSVFKGIQPYVGSGFETSYSFSWLDALLMIYLTGAAIFMFRILVQTAILSIQLIKNKTKSLDGIRIVETEKYGLPFSFFNIVYINPKFHKQDVLPEILAHEMVHIRERHWADLLIIELLTVIFWFNPIIWFFEHSIKLNHEYLADHGVISNGSPVGKYQALLVNQLMGIQIIGITNNLNFGINTNRLKMMTKQKTPKIKALKLVWAMPVVAILLFAFAEPNYKVLNTDQLPNEKVTQLIKEQKVHKFSGAVVNENGEAIPGVSVLSSGTTRGTTTDIDGGFSLNAFENAKIILSYVGYKSLTFTLEELFFLNNKKIVMKKGAFYLDDDMLSAGEIPARIKAVKSPPSPPNEIAKIEPPLPPPAEFLNDDGEEEIFTVVEKMPDYPGGAITLRDYICAFQIKLAKEENIKGKAKVGFTVDENGKISTIRIIESDNDKTAKGAMTILENMKRWKPGKQRGKAVPVNFVLAVKF